jgi:hypothetical protein
MRCGIILKKNEKEMGMDCNFSNNNASGLLHRWWKKRQNLQKVYWQTEAIFALRILHRCLELLCKVY